MKQHLFPFLVVTLIVGGCASVETGTSQEPREEAVYRTGSNIPSKHRPGAASSDGLSTYDKEVLDRARSSTAPPVSHPGLPPPGSGR